MSQRYERVANVDDDSDSVHSLAAIPDSPPPSFRSRASSPTSQRSPVDQNLADTFDADDSDSGEDDDVDDRQRLMRGSSGDSSPVEPAPESSIPPRQSETPFRLTQTPRAAAPGGIVYGGGSGSDGVFANLSAKPEAGEKLEEHPPTYEQAAADAAPPYWETTILAPGLGGSDEVYIDGLPVGSAFSFVWNGMISMSFQIVGFLLTYLLHTTHAAKNGSRAGLGMTLVQYGFYMKGTGSLVANPAGSQATGADPAYAQAPDPNSHDFDPNQVDQQTSGASSGSSDAAGMASSDWIAYILMIVGWFILIRAVSDYLKARRHEQLVLQSPERALVHPVVAPGEEPAAVV